MTQSMLERMEEEVSDFFESADQAAAVAAAANSSKNSSQATSYQSCLPSAYQRMLLQATSQYLNLVCKSKSLGFSFFHSIARTLFRGRFS